MRPCPLLSSPASSTPEPYDALDASANRRRASATPQAVKTSVWVLAAVAAALLAAEASAGRAAPGCPPTPADSFGPFGRGIPPIRDKIGTGHVLSGVVLSSLDCHP